MNQEGAQRALAVLRRFTQPVESHARCDLCSLTIEADHPHLLDPAERSLLCGCRACALLFSGHVAEGDARRYVRIEPRTERLPKLVIEEHEWSMLDLPVRLVFLCPSAVHARTFALYPNPAGVTEAHVSTDVWNQLVVAHPVLDTVRADVQAVIIDARAGQCTCYAVSIDVCHRLVGLLRSDMQPRTLAWTSFERALLKLAEDDHA